MNYRKCFIWIFCVSLCTQSYGQSFDDYCKSDISPKFSTAIKINLPSLALSTFNFGIEQSIVPDFSVEANWASTSKLGVDDPGEANYFYNGSWLTFGVKYYFKKTEKTNNYLSGFISGYHYTASGSYEEESTFYETHNYQTSSYTKLYGDGIGLTFGAEVFLCKHLFLDMYFGPTLYLARQQGNDSYGYPFTPIVFRMGIQVGLSI